MIFVELESRDRIELHHDEHGNEIVQAIACSACLGLIRQLQSTKKLVKDWDLPKGNSHSEILLRELILRARGAWKFPYADQELCHCRAVTTRRVDQAIIAGAHTMEQIRRATSATTGCGTCWDHIEKIIKYRIV